MTINLAGYIYSDNGTAIQSVGVTLIASDASTEDTTTTNSSGYWSFAEADEDVYDVKLAPGSQVRYFKGADKISLSEIDVRNSTGATTSAFTFSNTYNSASNQVGRFRSLNTTRADGDEIYLSFNLVNDNAEETEFARITAEANDVSNGTEDGEIRFSVMKAGTLTEVWSLNSSTAGVTSMDMNVDSFTIGSSTDGTDITLNFDGTTSDGVITWMEDEDYFKFSDDILMNSTEKIQFYDTGIYIYSSTDGQLDLVADTEIQIAATTIDINGAVAFDGALTGITNITLSGTLSDGNYTFDTSGNVTGLGTVASGAITSTGIVTGTGFTAGSAVLAEAELELLDGLTAGTAIASKVVTTDANIDTSGQRNLTITGELDAASLDIEGDADINGTLETDALTIGGTAIGSIYGVIAGSSSILTTGALDSGSITSNFGTIDTGSSTITTTGVITAGGLTIGSAVIIESELEMIDTITAGTAAANKAVVLDGSKNIATIGTIGSGAITSTGSSSFANIDVDGTTDLDNTDIDGTFAVDGTTISLDATTSLNIDNSNTSNGISIATATSGVPVTIGHGTSEVTVGDNLTVTGDLTVSGATTTITSTTVAVADSLLKVAKDQGTSADAVDFGIYGQYGVGGTAKWAGIFRDGSVTGDPWTFFDSVQAEPTTTVNVGGTGYDLAPISVGAITAADASTIASGTTIGNLTLGDGSIVDSSGAIAFGDENLSTTGNLDIDGTTNLDAVDIDGAVQIDAAFTSGVDGQGYDTKFFGDTSSAYMLWDTSADDLVFGGAAGIDLAGDIDVDGTANLDIVDIDGAVQIDNTITVGANDQGYDIIFYGDTASANITWDTSADDLIFNGGAGLIVPEGQFTLGSTAVGSTAGELNLLDGSAKSTASITIGDTDAFVVIDGTTTKQIPASDIKTYAASATAADDIADGDAAVSILTTTGNITIDAQANDADVIIKVDDAGAAVTAVTFDGSAAGDALFVNNINVPGEVMTTKISYTDGDDAITVADGGGTTFAAAVDLGSNTLTTTGSLQIRTIDYSDGDNAITIADGGGVTFAQAVDLGSNTLTTTGSLQVRTIDYSDGDVAMTIADGGGVTFSQAVDLGSNTLTTTGSLQVRTIDYSDGDVAMTIADGGGVTFSAAVDLGSNTLTSTGSMQIRTIDYSDGDLSMTIADGGGITFAQNIQTADIELGHASDTTIARSAAGEVTIEGKQITTAGKMDMWIPAAAMRPSSSNGCAAIADVETTSGRPDLQVLDFNKDSDEFAQFSVGMPQSWDVSETCTFQAYWTTASTNTDTVAWAMSGVCCGDNDTIDVAYATPVVATAKAASGTVEDLNISAESGAVTITGAAKGELVFFEIFRDVSVGTTHTADARLIGVKLTYTIDEENDA